VGANLRVVTQLPLRELWRDDGLSTTTRGKSLTLDEVREFLASGAVQFVVADVGRPFDGFLQVNASFSGRMKQSRT